MARSNGKYTVLVIEDEPDILNFASRALELEGCHVLKASDGGSGLALLSKHTVDLVLLDLRLPDIDGLAVLHEIRHTRELSKIPVVVITAHAELIYRRECLHLGVKKYLLKPLSADKLNKTVGKILHKKAIHRLLRKAYSMSHA